MLPRGVAQLGRALRSGRRGRVFESRHPDDFQRLLDFPKVFFYAVLSSFLIQPQQTTTAFMLWFHSIKPQQRGRICDKIIKIDFSV